MQRGRFLYFLFFIGITAFSLLPSCSTTKAVPEGYYRLKENKISITNHSKYPNYKVSDIENYVRQKPAKGIIKSWNPFLYIYNWDNGKGKGWDKFVHKLGQAPVIFDPALIDDSEENMATHLEYIGYYGSVIKDSLAAENKLATMFYSVTLGKQYPIKSISYEAVDTALQSIYFSDTANSVIKPGIPLSEKNLDAESERATSYLRNNGYYDFSKNYFFFEADTLACPDSATLKVIIKNYTRNEDEKDAKPHRKFYFGDVYVQPVSDVNRYRAALSLKLPMVLDTLKYKDITILYDKKRKMRPSVLNSMNRVVPGDLYRESTVNLTYDRYTNLRVYSSISVELNKIDSNVVNCNIRLLPTKVHGYKLNLEASTNSTGLIGISPALSYYNRNIFRGGEWLSLSVKGNFQFSVKNSTRAIEVGANAGLSFPTFVFLPDRIFKSVVPRTDVNLSYNYQKRPEYTRNMIGAKFGYSWPGKNRTLYYQVNPLQINIVNMSNVSASFIESLKNPFVRETYKNHFEFGSGFVFSYASDPSGNALKSNFKANLSVDIAGNLISAFNKVMPSDSLGHRLVWGSPYSQFVRTELSLVYTWKFGKNKKQALAVRALGGVGYAYGNSTTMPFERLFWGGGSNSLRGWAARSIGPGSAAMDTTFSIPNQTGDMRLEANIEYRFPIVWLLYGSVFFDWGNVWNIERAGQTKTDDSYFTFKNMFKTSAFNTGLGLRVDIKFVVIRFDWGIKLYDPLYQSWKPFKSWFAKGGSAFQFGIGYPF